MPFTHTRARGPLIEMRRVKRARPLKQVWDEREAKFFFSLSLFLSRPPPRPRKLFLPLESFS